MILPQEGNFEKFLLDLTPEYRATIPAHGKITLAVFSLGKEVRDLVISPEHLGYEICNSIYSQHKC